MVKQDLAGVSSGGFMFCRWGVMVMVWMGFVFRIKEFILVSFLVLLLSALLTVKRAPMIKFWDYTFGVFVGTGREVLDVKAMRFAHILGSVFSGICVLLLYFDVVFAWNFVLVFALVKTISAFGFCPASKLYSCMEDGGCCSFSRKMKKGRLQKC